MDLKNSIFNFLEQEGNSNDFEKNSMVRTLLCRLIDVYELWPEYYERFENAKLWLTDILHDEGDYSFCLSKGNKLNVILKVIDFRNERPDIENVKIPVFLLEDNWNEQVGKQKIFARINKIDKEILNINKIIVEGPERIRKLQEEKNKLKSNLGKDN